MRKQSKLLLMVLCLVPLLLAGKCDNVEEYADLALCLASCKNGTCEKTPEGKYVCVPNPEPTPTPTPEPTPTPVPTPVPTPTPEPTPEPTPLPQPLPTCGAEATLVACNNCCNPLYHDDIFTATQNLGSYQDHTPREALDALTKELYYNVFNKKVCVISGIEAIFIIRPDGRWDEYHAVSFGDSGWTNSGRGRYIGCHTDNSCKPLPNPNRMKFTIADKGNHIDTTYITVGQPDYCASIGYCCMPGTGTPPNTCGSPGCIPRGGCPVRPDGHPDRFRCEVQMIGKQSGTCNGLPLANFRGNPAQFVPCDGTFRTCTEDGKTCTEKEL